MMVIAIIAQKTRNIKTKVVSCCHKVLEALCEQRNIEPCHTNILSNVKTN